MTDVSEIQKVKIDSNAKALTFSVQEGFDIESKLSELAGSVKFFEDFAIN